MDFPAAHSMDTMWFAVDADGHVAAFESGEGGGVPMLAYLGEDYFDVAQQLRDLPETGAKLDLDGHVSNALGHQHVEGHWRTPGTDVVAFVADADSARDLVAKLGATVSPATTGHVLHFELGDLAAFDELHARGACMFCESEFPDEQGELAAHGVYRYACDDGIAIPYTRLAVPTEPLAIADAPADVRANAIRFAGKFADTAQLQPAEHWKSQGWSAGWLATDGKTLRPFPGRESDFTKENVGDSDYVIVNEAIEQPDGELADPKPAAKRPWWKLWRR